MDYPLAVDGEIYRYRTADALTGPRKELARQEIYLALPRELNDPMEGRVNLVFRGDAIVWPNFLRHYVRSLVYAASWAAQYPIHHYSGTDEVWMPGTYNLGDLTERLEEKGATLLKSATVAQWIGLVSNEWSGRGEDVTCEEISELFQNVHPMLLAEYELIAPTMFRGFKDTAFNTSSLTDHARISGLLSSDSLLEERLSAINFKMEEVWTNEILDFPAKHIERLKSRLHRDWAAACFTTKRDQELMWTHYADGHRGACLVFDSARLKLSNTGSPHVFQSLKDVDYVSQIPRIEFFSNIGRMTAAEVKQFFTAPSGDFSPLGCHLLASDFPTTWVKGLNEQAIKHAATKLKSYAYESEMRIIGWSAFEREVVPPENRMVRYPMESLRGIIFGERMARADRVAVREALMTKHLRCSMDWFQFWQEETTPSGTRLRFTPLNNELGLYLNNPTETTQ